MATNDQPLEADAPVEVVTVRSGDWSRLFGALDGSARMAVIQARFTAKSGQLVYVPARGERPGHFLFGLADDEGAMAYRGLAGRLPPGDYFLGSPPAEFDGAQIASAWALGAYRFDRYKRAEAEAAPRLVGLSGVNTAEVEAIAGACTLVRDMINTPANDMGPAEVEAVARGIAEGCGARIDVVVGDDLLAAGYPAVHAVGRAAAPARAPRMVEMSWGEADHPLIALVGKGVVFDSGGLDIKPSAGMRQMKKDMGGGAHVLALARMMMAAKLPVRLAVLVPAVENAISGDAMRPGDILASREGLSIEVGNTDAEGRLILADALARASELSPVLTIDMATLTGAARVALGPDVVPFYTDDDELAAELTAAATRVSDPLWRMPLWSGYDAAIDSDIADVANDAEPWAQAGSITAALFLKRFAPKTPWVHFDIFGWNPRNRPGWPKGAEAQAIRAIYAVLKARYG
jgi:leucyl aminopeptidase